MRTRYRIAYAYPTSPNAKTLGVYHEGGYYVERSVTREDGHWSPPHIAPGCDGDVFSRADHPDLLALLAECEARAAIAKPRGVQS